MMMFLMSSLILISLIYNWYLYRQVEAVKSALESSHIGFTEDGYLEDLDGIDRVAKSSMTKIIVPRDMLYEAFPFSYHPFLEEGWTLDQVHQKTVEIREKLNLNGSGWVFDDGRRINQLASRLGAIPYPNRVRNHMSRLEQKIGQAKEVLNRKLLPFRKKGKVYEGQT